jgi:hypothetical protein
MWIIKDSEGNILRKDDNTLLMFEFPDARVVLTVVDDSDDYEVHRGEQQWKSNQ